jgi:hypothetical protein
LKPQWRPLTLSLAASLACVHLAALESLHKLLGHSATTGSLHGSINNTGIGFCLLEQMHLAGCDTGSNLNSSASQRACACGCCCLASCWACAITAAMAPHCTSNCDDAYALPRTLVAAARIAPLFSIWSSRWLMCGVRLSAKACLWPSCSCSEALARNSSSCSK